MTPNLDDLATRIAELVALELTGTERALEIGRLLIEAKDQIDHGGWIPFVKRCGLTHSTAKLYMRVARRWKDDDPDAQRVAKLALRDVQKLIATPKAKTTPAPPAAFPTSNIANLPTGPCKACGRSCECAPASAADLDDEEAA